MFVKIYSPSDGVVKGIEVTPGELVNPDTIIAVLE